MCEWGTTELVHVRIPADLSATGKARWKWARIDSCIAPLVRALQESGIDMRGSCCGHGESFGDIHLQDGRVLIITDISYFSPPWRWALKALYRTVRMQLRLCVTNRWKLAGWAGKGKTLERVEEKLAGPERELEPLPLSEKLRNDSKEEKATCIKD